MDKEIFQTLKDISVNRMSHADVCNTVRAVEDRMKRRHSAVYQLLQTIPGEDPQREGLLETPDRVARMYEEIFGGYEMRPEEILSKTFQSDEDVTGDIYRSGIVAVRDIPFYSHCEHHMVPFIGKAHIAYIPKERVVGLSKLARLVECYARRLQIQERMTTQIADAIDKILQPQGVMVVVQAEHLCMAMRGVKKPGTQTVTSVVRGVFVKPEAREEAMSIFGFGR